MDIETRVSTDNTMAIKEKGKHTYTSIWKTKDWTPTKTYQGNKNIFKW